MWTGNFAKVRRDAGDAQGNGAGRFCVVEGRGGARATDSDRPSL